MLIKTLLKTKFFQKEFNLKLLKFQEFSNLNFIKNFIAIKSVSFCSSITKRNEKFELYKICKKHITLNSTNLQSLKVKSDVYQLLHEIVENWSINGKTCVIPWNDEQAMMLILKPFEVLLDEGVERSFLFDACTKREELLRAFTKHGKKLLNTMNVIMECTGFTYENTLRFIANYSNELLNATPQSIESCFFVFLSRGIAAGKQMGQLLLHHPEIIYASSAQKMDATLETLSSFFSQNELLALLITSPQISLQTSESLKERYEYIYYHMAIEPENFQESLCWHELDLKEIMTRHEFLRRTGKYFLPDPKRPQIKMQNPSIYKIFDTDDYEFSTQVAGVRKEEWILFKELFEKESIEKNLEEPYPKIKPSLRKFYERKRMNKDVEQIEYNENNF